MDNPAPANSLAVRTFARTAWAIATQLPPHAEFEAIAEEARRQGVEATDSLLVAARYAKRYCKTERELADHLVKVSKTDPDAVPAVDPFDGLPS